MSYTTLAADQHRVPLVLLPGLDGTGAMFRPLVRELPPKIRPIVVQYPNDRTMTYEQLREIILPQLPDEPFVMLGESFGGPLAMLIAASNPASLRAIILCATFVRHPVRFRPMWLRYFARPTLFRFRPLLNRARARLGGRDVNGELRSLFGEVAKQMRPAIISFRVRETFRIDVREVLKTTSLPILYLRGARDRVVRSHNAREICSINSSVQCITFDSPHWLLQSQSAAAAKIVSEFALRHAMRDC